mmetsp:Transcript_4653/g.11102  ORF Transcript_4653/g.11102 Transcript_4653/m.11102 type:complete len:174 (-) Transcript_4653:158-679(-)
MVIRMLVRSSGFSIAPMMTDPELPGPESTPPASSVEQIADSDAECYKCQSYPLEFKFSQQAYPESVTNPVYAKIIISAFCSSHPKVIIIGRPTVYIRPFRVIIAIIICGIILKNHLDITFTFRSDLRFTKRNRALLIKFLNYLIFLPDVITEIGFQPIQERFLPNSIQCSVFL